MLNQVILVGRLTKDLIVKKSENGKEYSIITIAVGRPYKNEKGEYDADFINCKLSGNLATNTSKYCEKGDLIGIKGNLNSFIKGKLIVNVEKVTFLTKAKNKEEDKTKSKEEDKTKSKEEDKTKSKEKSKKVSI